MGKKNPIGNCCKQWLNRATWMKRDKILRDFQDFKSSHLMCLWHLTAFFNLFTFEFCWFIDKWYGENMKVIKLVSSASMLELCSRVRCIYISFQSLNYFNYDIGEGQESLKILICLMEEEYIYRVCIHNVKQENIKVIIYVFTKICIEHLKYLQWKCWFV